MDLSTLSPDEALALVALLKTCVGADGAVSDEEGAELDEVVDALGDERYRTLATQADERFREEKDLRAFLSSITRQEARDTLFGIVLDAEAGGAMQGRDLELLDWLRAAWAIEVKVVDEPDA